ncbi:hypothetical protein M0R45_011155 [Rubus argutus]|uniref:Uncharacterized protein n=1 Tax=Rubus argutus TaxID=59490 RepID=A0AAW1YA67_RUBAR
MSRRIRAPVRYLLPRGVFNMVKGSQRENFPAKSGIFSTVTMKLGGEQGLVALMEDTWKYMIASVISLHYVSTYGAR